MPQVAQGCRVDSAKEFGGFKLPDGCDFTPYAIGALALALVLPFSPLDRASIWSAVLNPESASGSRFFLRVPRALKMYVVAVRALENESKNAAREVHGRRGLF